MTGRIPLSTTSEAQPATDAVSILQLQLLIARAASMDSLQWWDDASLTEEAGFLLDRLMPMAPLLAARSLALTAARERHEAACSVHKGALHLYRLDASNRDQLALRSVSLLSVPVPKEPIQTIEVLRQHLLNQLAAPLQHEIVRRLDGHGMQITLPPCPRGVPPMLHRARTLAWAYLDGALQQPVFPFLLESATRPNYPHLPTPVASSKPAH